jgi:hypothetical protein
VRNAYTLLDFGDWIDDKSTDTGPPYIQLASITDSVQAQNDFIKMRLSGTNTLSDSKWALLPVDQMQHSPVSEEEKNKQYQEMILSRWPYILAGCLLFLFLVIGLCVWRCCCRKGAKGGARGKKAKSAMYHEDPTSTTHLPLQEPQHSKGGYSPDPRHDSGLYPPPSSSQYSLDSSYPADPHYSHYPPPPQYSGPSSPPHASPYAGHHV